MIKLSVLTIVSYRANEARATGAKHAVAVLDNDGNLLSFDFDTDEGRLIQRTGQEFNGTTHMSFFLLPIDLRDEAEL
jgi:hypothetical protein